jgi:hypothetical protein
MSSGKITKSRKTKASAKKKTNECPICLTECTETLCFPCKHDVCKACYKNPRLARCPLCRMDKNGKTGEEQREEVDESNPRPTLSVSFLQIGDVVRASDQLPPGLRHAFVPGSGGTPMDIPGLQPNQVVESLLHFVNRRN